MQILPRKFCLNTVLNDLSLALCTCVLFLMEISFMVETKIPIRYGAPDMDCHFLCSRYRTNAVLRIRDILVQIWIRGSVPLTKGSGSKSCYFSLLASRR
jgi:hypothetical protein